MNYDVIFIGAHPDDMILSSAGTIASFVEKGLKCLIVSVTSGGYNDYEKGRIRQEELAATAKLLKVDYTVLDLIDTEVRDTIEESSKILDVIITTNPSIIVTHNEGDFHPDHVSTNKIVRRAVFHYFVRSELSEKNLKGLLFISPIRWNTQNLNSLNFNFFVDISKYVDFKRQLISMHKSQMASLQRNMEITLALNQFIGKLRDVEYAEGFYYDDFGKSNIEIGHILNVT